MILKNIYIFPELEDYGKEIVYPFKEQSRSICNFLERKIKDLKYNSKGFRSVCFVGKRHPSKDFFVNSSNVLNVDIYIDESRYKSTTIYCLNSYFIEIIKSGLDKCGDILPIAEITSALNEFENSGYVNEWVHKKRFFKNQNITCSLVCNHSIKDFRLSLKIMRADDVIFNEVILITPPDELAYHYKFKDIIIDNDEVIVTTKLHSEPDNVLFRFKLKP
ncbi:hypothetical protein C5E22_22180 [Pectobacterium parmentieri]|uniref:hypothetical protein n=1 Tax=Pectobacterium parmentieri TaxID=1905730 RepID=UPI000EAE2B5E|nr:hypothetical protein [Pectobacterium parmentieri]AYH20923.1 hypothetical protein C5E22_22180 [Pectobacterium parmentieri]AYH25183.1 hypothetical protein C5E21_21150 [Pectobacterium parmentieri]MBN3177315.1 hypothetical protein [Pectobacterium parmentieri]QRN29817.1 hypothetical protein IG623_21640 [Pectobacterium parmentieri]